MKNKLIVVLAIVGLTAGGLMAECGCCGCGGEVKSEENNVCVPEVMPADVKAEEVAQAPVEQPVAVASAATPVAPTIPETKQEQPITVASAADAQASAEDLFDDSEEENLTVADNKELEEFAAALLSDEEEDASAHDVFGGPNEDDKEVA